MDRLKCTIASKIHKVFYTVTRVVSAKILQFS